MVDQADPICPRPTPNVAVLHSPTPSRVKIAALFKGTGEERTGSVAFVMVGEDQTCRGFRRQSSPQSSAHVQLVFEPERHRQPKLRNPLGTYAR